MKRFLDVDPGAGGGNPAETPPADPGITPGTEGPPAGPGEPGEKGGGKETPEPKNFEVLYTDLKTKHDTLSATVGKQGNELGPLRELLGKIEKDPEAFMRDLAGKKGIKLNIGENTAPDVDNLFDDDGNVKLDRKSFAELMKNTAEGIEKKVMLASDIKNAAVIANQMEATLKAKHEDWGDLESDRTGVKADLLNQKQTHEEVIHYAVKGMRLPQILADYKDKVTQEIYDELKKKGIEFVEAPGSGATGEPPKKHDPDDPAYLKEVVAKMQKAKY